MRRLFLLVLGVCVGLGWMGTPEAVAFDAAAVDEAIEKGTQFLLSSQDPNGSWGVFGKPGPGAHNFHYSGPTALAVYALLESGVNPQNPKVDKALNWLAAYDKEDRTYSLGLRCLAWHAADRKRPGRYVNKLREDAKKLWLAGRAQGNYTYVCDPTKTQHGWDNSNTQYGLLGVWAAAMANIEVPAQYWQVAMKHWQACQQDDGGWGYKGRGQGGSTSAMVTGGIASLFVCYDQAYFEHFTKCNTGKTDYPRIKRGLDWLDKNFAATLGGQKMGHSDLYYYLYGIERVGLASGYKYFGRVDWYKQGAQHLIRTQGGGGSWRGRWGEPVGTSFALLFLIRGRNAVIMNKLDFTGDWNNRPRDLANLTRWMNKKFERTVNWQIINLKAPVTEWHDAPILYISASRKPTFSEEEIKKLRTFVNQGGTIFGVSECGGAAGFKAGIREVYTKLFPDYPLTPCPTTHPIYTKKVYFDLPSRPRFHIASNGVRPLIVHTDEDLPLSWQLRRTVTRRWAFEAAFNVIKYVTDRVSLVRPRGTTHWPEAFNGSCSTSVKLARLKHGGNWNPEPLAYERFGNLLAARHQVQLDLAGPMEIRDLAASGAKVAALTGTGELKLTDAQQTALKDFAAKGGLLVIDAAGGDRAFADSAEKMLKKMYGSFKVRILSSSSRLYRQSGMPVSKVKYRKRTNFRLGGRTTPNLRGVMLDGGRIGLIFSREDLTGGLVGYPSWTIDGYAPESAFDLMRNIVVSAK